MLIVLHKAMLLLQMADLKSAHRASFLLANINELVTCSVLLSMII